MVLSPAERRSIFFSRILIWQTMGFILSVIVDGLTNPWAWVVPAAGLVYGMLAGAWAIRTKEIERTQRPLDSPFVKW